MQSIFWILIYNFQYLNGGKKLLEKNYLFKIHFHFEINGDNINRTISSRISNAATNETPRKSDKAPPMLLMSSIPVIDGVSTMFS